MKLLLHVCCAPCLMYPLEILKSKDIEVMGYFFNPNIHPYREFRKRLTTLKDFSKDNNLNLEVESEYNLNEYLRKVVFNEDRRCSICYEMRLRKTVIKAVKIGADAFSSTLLYSTYQNHESIREMGNKLSKEYGIQFLYNDFRVGWQKGIDKSIAMNLYRQPYCGCIYSEQERYDKKLKKKCNDSESTR